MERCKGFPDVRHSECGGQLAVSGEGWFQIPLGFGFDSSSMDKRDKGRFVIDAARYPTYSGFCMKCGREGQFIREDKRPTHKRIRTKHRCAIA